MKKAILILGLLLLTFILAGCITEVGSGPESTNGNVENQFDEWNEECNLTTEAKLEELKITIEKASANKTDQTIDVYLSGCVNPGKEYIKINSWNDSAMCADICDSPTNFCLLLAYNQIGQDNRIISDRSISKCLEIQPDTIFETESSRRRCPEKEKYQLEYNSLPIGKYLLTNETKETDNWPTVCAYRDLSKYLENKEFCEVDSDCIVQNCKSCVNKYWFKEEYGTGLDETHCEPPLVGCSCINNKCHKT